MVPVKNKRVLAIYTGVLVPQKNIEKVVRKLPQLHDEEYWSKNLAGTDMKEYLVIPDGKDTELKVLYKIHEYEEYQSSSHVVTATIISSARSSLLPLSIFLKSQYFSEPSFLEAQAKTTLDVDPKMLIHPPGSVPDECRLHDTISRKVYILKVAPTITPELIRARKEIYKEIERAVKNEVLVVNVTQCINGTVLGKAIYETGL
ncbi:Lyso, partial [Operophtera brumata]